MDKYSAIGTRKITANQFVIYASSEQQQARRLMLLSRTHSSWLSVFLFVIYYDNVFVASIRAYVISMRAYVCANGAYFFCFFLRSVQIEFGIEKYSLGR